MPRHLPFSVRQGTEFFRVPTDRESLLRYYTFNPLERSWIDAHRGDHNRLGFGVLLCHLKYPGFVPPPDQPLDEDLVAHVCEQLVVPATVLGEYAKRDQTRREHLLELQRLLALRPFAMEADGEQALAALGPIALETSAGILVLEQLVRHFRDKRVLLPSIPVLQQLCAEAITRGKRAVAETLAAALSQEQKKSLAGLLIVPDGESITPLGWIRQSVTGYNPRSILEHLKRLEYVRSLKIPRELGRLIPPDRLRKLAAIGLKKGVGAFRQLEPSVRYAMLAAVAIETEVTLQDQAIQLSGKIVGLEFSRSKRNYQKEYLGSKQVLTENVAVLTRAVRALAKAKSNKADPFVAIEAAVPWTNLMESLDWAESFIKRDEADDVRNVIDGYRRVHRYAGKFLEATTLHANPAAKDVYDAAMAVRRIHREGSVPAAELPMDFLNERRKWRSLVTGPDGRGRDLRYYEMFAMAALSDALGSTDICAEGSRHYGEIESSLLPKTVMAAVKEPSELGIPLPADAREYLGRNFEKLRRELKSVDQAARDDLLPGVELKPGILKFHAMEKTVPPGAKEFAGRLHRAMERVKITQLLMEVHRLTNFGAHFTHLKKGTPPPPEKIHIVLTALLSQGLNLGPVKMAEACPDVSPGELLWAYDYYVREETFPAVLAELVNAQRKYDIARNWGDGTTSSSDGQRFRAGGPAYDSGDYNRRYGSDPGRVHYSWLSDQYFPYYSKLLLTALRDSTHVIDGWLGHASDLRIREHYTDTLGFTDHVFATARGMDCKFSPRIRDFAAKKLYFPPGFSVKLTHLDWMKGGEIDDGLVEDQWSDIIRMFASIRKGVVTSSMMMEKLSYRAKHHSLSLALGEMGRLERTLFMLEWLKDPALRRRSFVGLNKHESMHALSRAVFLHRGGNLYDRSFEDQRLRASGLTIVVAAIIFWNTVRLDALIQSRRRQKEPVEESFLPHVTPLAWEHINLTGDYIWPKQGFA